MSDLKYPCAINMPAFEYHEHGAIGSSSVRILIDQTPAHYLQSRTERDEPTPAMKIGTIVHEAILEPKKFVDNMIVMPEFSGTGSRAAKDQWLTLNHSKTIVTRDHHEMVLGMLKSISNHKQASRLVSEGSAEQSYFWIDPFSNMPCKCRPDFLRDNHIVVDVKTTDDASYQAFQKTIVNFGYHIQAAMYLDGVSAVTGRTYDEFIVLVVEKKPPYAVNTFLIDESAINEGRALYLQALKTLRKCHDNKHFPAYPEEITPIALPTWGYKGEIT